MSAPFRNAAELEQLLKEHDELQRSHYEGQAWLIFELLERYEDVHPKGAPCLVDALEATRAVLDEPAKATS